MDPKSRMSCDVAFVMKAPAKPNFSAYTMPWYDSSGCVRPGNLSPCAIQSNRPASTMAPPTPQPCPSIYLVVECVTISAPHSIGRQFTGVGKVLSTMSGTPWSCAACANVSMSSTASAGFAIVSPKTALVLGRKAASSSSSDAFGATKVHSMPILRIVWAIRLNVPP